MENRDFQLLMAKAEMYAECHVENRVFLFAIDRGYDEFPAEFIEAGWDLDNADVQIFDSMAEFVMRQDDERESMFDCFNIKYLDAELYHNGKLGTPHLRSFTTPAEDGLMTFEQEVQLREAMYKAFDNAIEDSEWAEGDCFEHSLECRMEEQQAINNLIS